ncbi:MAG: hypothetical protein HUK22_00305, partial [Thermoguttaceae bacterium]|nr:hypothetical protein [Thermoguttaceae bacterium]
MKNTSLFAILVLAATTAFGFVGQVGAEDDLEKLLMEDPNESLGALGSPALDSPLSQLPTADTSAPDAALPTPTSAPRQSTPDPIETKENDVVVRNASVVIPKGEGYEAII